MNLEMLTFNGYGQYIWSAFIFTFLASLILYFKTQKELKKQEKLFVVENKKFTPKTVVTSNKEEILSSKPVY